jgi:hypothetical protein
MVTPLCPVKCLGPKSSTRLTTPSTFYMTSSTSKVSTSMPISSSSSVKSSSSTRTSGVTFQVLGKTLSKEFK